MTRHIPTSGASLSDNRRLAAEEAAIQLGWLSECPYHGEPFRSAVGLRDHPEAARSVPADVIAAVTEVCESYEDRCRFCAREGAIPE